MIPGLCALFSGVMIYFSIQLGAVWWLAWLALLPVLWLAFGDAQRRTVVATCWVAYAIGMCHLIPAYWGFLPDAMVIVSIVLPGFLLAAVALAARLVADRLSPLAGTVTFAALWTSVFYLLSFGADGTAPSWAYSQVGAPVLMQSASLFGLWVVGFVLVFFPAGLAMSLARRGKWPAIAAVALFAANAVYGSARIATAEPGAPVRVGLGGDDALAVYTSDPAFTQEAVSAYVSATRKLAADHVSLLVFPEKVAVLTKETRAPVVAQLQSSARTANATLVIGFDDRSGPERRNDAYVVQPDGTVDVYSKRHLVPGLEAGFVPGPDGLTLPNRTGIAICKDMDFQRMLRTDAASHPTLFAVPAWDFETDRWWHARLAILRGVEDGFSVARAAKDGLLTVSDAYGHVLARRPTSRDGMVTLTADVPRGPGDTLYRKVGDVFAWAALITSALLLGLAAAAKPTPAPRQGAQRPSAPAGNPGW